MRAVHRTPVKALAVVSAGLTLTCFAWIAMHSRPAHAAFPGKNGLITFSGDRDGDFEIFTIHADGSHRRQLTHNGTEDDAPAFSANGRKIVFTRDVDLTNFLHREVFTMNRDGSHQHQITDDAVADKLSPGFSPNGKKVVYWGSGGIETISVDGGTPHQLTHNAYQDARPTWSPNGKKIAFESTVGDLDGEIYTMEPDGSHRHALTDNAKSERDPNYSPDGSRIVVSGTRTVHGNTQDELLVMNANGTHERNVTKSSSFELSPAFSPNGKLILFTNSPISPGKRGAEDTDFELLTIHPDGKHRHALTHNSTSDYSPDWQPKHRHHH